MTICILGKRNLFCGLLMVLGMGLCAQSQRAVMVRGNQWITENPGFGSEEITALFGEYQIEFAPSKAAQNEAARDEAARLFYVRASANPRLLSASGWLPRTGSAYLQRQEAGYLFVGLPFDGGTNFGTWTIIFQFPLPEETGTGFWDAATINRLVGVWISRFRYFLSRVKISSDMSLPAVVDF